jgi:hypothetical protein
MNKTDIALTCCRISGGNPIGGLGIVLFIIVGRGAVIFISSETGMGRGPVVFMKAEVR